MSDTLGDLLRRHFTRETGLYITSEEHSIPESYEKDWSEFFDGDVGEFLDRDDMKKFRDLDSILDCEIAFHGYDCLIHVAVYDSVLEENDDTCEDY